MDQEQMVDAVRDWLDGDDWNYDYDAERKLIKTGINLDCKLKSTKIFIDFRENCYMVLSFAPINGDKENLGELMKYLTMANYGLKNGNFELDVNDGEIRYKVYVDTDGLNEISEKIIKASILVGYAMMERYGNGIAALAMGFSDADTEIRKAEHPDEQQQ